MKTKEQSIFNHKGNIIKTEDKNINIVARVEEPLIVVLDNVLSEEECDQLIELSKERIERSKVLGDAPIQQGRTSSGMFFKNAENDLVAKIEKRIAQIMNLPVEHGEGLQILNYKRGQEYQPHYDFFPSTSRMAENNRVSTMVIYLNDVEEGGETSFPELGYSVSPKKGSAVYFEYSSDDSSLNELTLHSGSPVVVGEKWAATQWMKRNKIR